MTNTKIDLSTRAMLADLSLTLWSPRKHDKRESLDVETRHNAASGVARVTKSLIDLKAKTWTDVMQSSGNLRTHFYTNTMPWSDEGPRILPATNYLTFITEQRALRSKHDANVSAFEYDSANLFADGLKRLNGMGNSDDYPTQSELRKKFSYKLDILPIPATYDFRVTDMATIDVQEICDNLEASYQASTANAMQSLYSRLYESVSHMAEKLSTVDSIFRDSLVDNIKAHCELIPRLNLTGDANLEAMRARIENELTQINASDLRANAISRSAIADRAKQIQSDLAAFMA